MPSHFLQRADPGERQQGGEAAGVAHEDVRVQPIPHHDGARRVNVKLAGHAVKYITAGLPYTTLNYGSLLQDPANTLITLKDNMGCTVIAVPTRW